MGSAGKAAVNLFLLQNKMGEPKNFTVWHTKQYYNLIHNNINIDILQP